MCASFALLKLRLVLTQPGRLSKVHVEFLHHCSDNPQLSTLSYTQTTRKFYQEEEKRSMHRWERIHIHFLSLICLLCLSLCPTSSPFLFICTIRLSAVFPINFLLFCSYSDSTEIVKVRPQAAEAWIHIIHTRENEIYFCKYSSILNFEENIGFTRTVTMKCCFSFFVLA